MNKILLISLFLIMVLSASSQRRPPYVYWAHWWFPWPKYVTTREILPPDKRSKIKARRMAYRAYRRECKTHLQP